MKKTLVGLADWRTDFLNSGMGRGLNGMKNMNSIGLAGMVQSQIIRCPGCSPLFIERATSILNGSPNQASRIGFSGVCSGFGLS